MLSLDARIPGLDEGQILAAERQRHLMYAHRVSDVLARELTHYCEANRDVTDLTHEIAICRNFVGEALQSYSNLLTQYTLACEALASTPGDLILEGKRNLISSYMSIARENVSAATDRVQNMALAMSKIQSNRQGKVDMLVMNNIAAVVSRCVDTGLIEYQGDIGQQRAQLISNTIAELLDGALGQVINPAGLGLGNQQLQLTSYTPDQMVTAMSQTVPAQPIPQTAVAM